jgi:tripartite-type tricarboxylate transporter receptor subunit TctC
VSNWLGLIAPKGTPAAIVNKLNDAFNRVLALPDMRQKIAGPGNVVGGGTPEEFAAFAKDESERWSALVKRVGIKVE